MKDELPGKDWITLGEEAVHLLRRAPFAAWLSYYLGTMPFSLGLLYFISDMSRGSYADSRLAVESFAMVGLFAWMKTWQAVAAITLRDYLRGVPGNSKLSIKGWFRLAFAQFRLQTWGLIALPVSLLITIPFGWVFAYYQNLTALGSYDPVKLSNLHKQASRQARLWPKQNHLILLLISTFGFAVLVNIIIALMSIPRFMITFLGMKEVFEPTIWTLLNTTFLSIAIAAMHLVIDPLIKAVYILRCFYGESRATGEDLQVQLQRSTSLRLLASIICISMISISTLNAAEPNPASARTQPVTSQKLDQQITEVLNKREYSWRLPREKSQKAESSGLFTAFVEEVGEMIGRALKTVFEFIGEIFKWIISLFETNKTPQEKFDKTFIEMLPRLLLWILIFGLGIGLIIFLAKNRRRLRNRKVVEIEQVQVIPDISDENIRADQLPEDEWLKMARDLMESGNIRLAIRALFLGSLATLAQKEKITLARFKSNREYERELRRRAATIPLLLTAFSTNVGIYDRVWYGLYEPSPDLYSQFQTNVEQIRAC